MANVNTSVEQLLPQAGSDNKKQKIGFLSGVTKAGATDTITVSNSESVVHAVITNDTTGLLDPITDITNNVITLSVGTGTVSGQIIYK